MESTIIKNIRIEKVTIPLESPFKISLGAKFSIENVIILVQLENNITGFGEAAPIETINGESQATVIATINSCRDFLLGKDASDFRQISKTLKKTFSPQITAIAAIEMALLDAYTKSLGLPLYKYLGGAENEIETDFTIGITSLEIAKNNAEKLCKEGFRSLKTKVGGKLNDDIERVLAIREGAPNCKIMLDANQGYSPKEALIFLHELEKKGIQPELFEQPVNRYDLEGMKFVKDHTIIPVVADESVFTSHDALNVIRLNCADYINIKIMKSGVVEALQIATLAKNANLGLMIGCMLETSLGLSMSVHLAAGLGGFSYIDLDSHIQPEFNPFKGGPAFEAPRYMLSDMDLGIGISWKDDTTSYNPDSLR